ncbi:sigma 54-interacting transcriptional regulator [Paraliomyxa miuraensis]|uniref:sigma 54-interacting transcriptional regulator n=1 Tax=Paraliomyxa miuraensis TaxID=376150 RepID=UPI00224CCD34|nr:sigma 54-interacting transcriptional regulator [Paraliomyxa miuraensis]MCX4241022.1 sigma 54-interacting transcriptional regulator [Paraliomyxa miuraensis]
MHTVPLWSSEGIVALRRRRLRLEVVRGPDKKKRVELERDRIVIGTHERCDLVLTDPTVSRQHLEIELSSRGYAIRDLDSLNGVYADDVRIREIVVTKGLLLTLGDTRVKLAPLSDTVDLPLPRQTQCGALLGRSTAMRRVFARLLEAAATDASVLVTGEPGTGKELAARAVHEHGRRAHGPWVVVDCTVPCATALQSALFGHEHGAFAGAGGARMGAFEAASGGTLLLDEVGELPLEVQGHLLMALEHRRVQSLGGSRIREFDVRLVATTRRDLRREVNREAFLPDLHARLATIDLHLPPLRERPEDVPLYVEAFLADQAAAGASLVIDPIAMDRLGRRAWPGNVRELRAALEHAAMLPPAGSPASTAAAPRPRPHERLSALPPVFAPDPSDPSMAVLEVVVDPQVPLSLGRALLVERYEQAYVEALMHVHDGDVDHAAKTAGLDRVSVLRRLDLLRATKR